MSPDLIPPALMLALQPSGGDFWMPIQASTSAGDVDRVFYFILYVSMFFFALIVGLMLLFVIRYRRRSHDAPPRSPSHNTPLEVAWTVIPLLIVTVMFAWGFKVFLDLHTPPSNAIEIQVVGQKWKWLFTYPNGHVDESLHVPVGRPVKLVMTSEDVIHSFFVPAFRVKRDVVPGRYTVGWFEATQTGQFPLYCAEYCGTGHSDMLTDVIVHRPGGYERWLEQAADFLTTMSPAEAGERLYRVRGCAQCHSVDGTSGIGPSFKGVAGHQVQLATGQTVTADENYLRESILDPQAKIVAGYQPVMPTYKGRLKEEEIAAIIAYMKTLQ